MDSRLNKLEELCKDPVLVEQIFVEDTDQTLANLAAQGIQMTKDEFKEFATGVARGVDHLDSDDLDEEALSAVAGGAKKKNRGFLNGLFDAADDSIFGTAKGAKPSGVLYAVGYTIGYGLNKIG